MTNGDGKYSFLEIGSTVEINGDAFGGQVSGVLFLGYTLSTIERRYQPLVPVGCWEDFASFHLLVGLICKDPIYLQMVVSATKSYLMAMCQTYSDKPLNPVLGVGSCIKSRARPELFPLLWIESVYLVIFLFSGRINTSYCARNWAADTELLTIRRSQSMERAVAALFGISNIKTTYVTFLYDLWNTIQIQEVLTTKGSKLRLKV